ncbi:MAG: DUF924 domain-containing protein [Myxococcales bacterium]|nr:DUF924 domain-containing protein [Myxococcales bacterium]
MTRHEDVILFWFASLDLTRPPDDATRARWFASDPEFDAAIAAQFADCFERSEFAPEALGTATEALAAVIVFDQFSRNAFRGTARAFAYDPRARAIADRALEQGFDREVSFAHRPFFYLPSMHHEDLASQQRAVALYTAMADDAANTPEAAATAAMLPFATQHRALIEAYGRFPGRNRALGRVDTEAERAYLMGGGQTFGQR